MRSSSKTRTTRTKSSDENEVVRDVRQFSDAGRCHVTPLATFPPAVALAVVDSLGEIVPRAHASKVALTPDDDGIVRAQTFEEGDVYMIASPFDGYFADRYLMDFYDVDAGLPPARAPDPRGSR